MKALHVRICDRYWRNRHVLSCKANLKKNFKYVYSLRRLISLKPLLPESKQFIKKLVYPWINLPKTKERNVFYKQVYTGQTGKTFWMFFQELHVMILLPQLSWFVIFNTTILLKNWKLLICSVLNFYDVTEKDKHKYIVLRDRTLSRSGEEGREGLCRGHERQILKGHEIYFKIFDGSQKMFLCTSFLFFFFFE